ncbi:MAG: hypothetical protein J3Q66DRAFT_200921 [Benniella sp.]|nr:MAG: hypothetical protein J3Q66DRAFT_200921 [Benniella sp.]
MEPVEDPPMVAKLRSLLNRGARIEITDGRVFMGQFMCIDHSKNIILAGAFESRPTQPLPADQSTTQPAPGVAEALATLTGDDASKRKPGIPKKAPPPEDEKRFVGQVMIPGHHIVRAEMDCSHLRGTDSRLQVPGIFDLNYLRG